MHIERLLRCTSLLGLTVITLACASSPEETPDAGQGPVSEVPVPLGCAEGATQSCVCTAGGVGERTCHEGEFGPCNACETPPDDGKIRCVPGRYRAKSRVEYRPGPAGICYVTAPGEATVFEGEMTFTLEQSGSSEFYTVGNGCLRVPGQGEDAGMAAGDIDWRAEVVGEVNCATGELNAEIRSTYFVVSVCTLGQIPTRYFAKGPFHAVYNPDTETFEDGTMIMNEPPVLFGDPPGGIGTWEGTLDNDRDAAVEDRGPCLGDTIFDDSIFPPDAGG